MTEPTPKPEKGKVLDLPDKPAVKPARKPPEGPQQTGPREAICGVRLHPEDASHICTCAQFRVVVRGDGTMLFVCAACRTAHGNTEGFRWVEL